MLLAVLIGCVLAIGFASYMRTRAENRRIDRHNRNVDRYNEMMEKLLQSKKDDTK